MLEKLEFVGRLDLIWNLCLPQSLKQATRQKRGSSCRVSVKECTVTPSDFGIFLKLNKIKPNFPILSPIGSAATEGKQLCTALENNSVYAADINHVKGIALLKSEKADTKIILHTFHCAKQGYDRAIIKKLLTQTLKF